MSALSGIDIALWDLKGTMQSRKAEALQSIQLTFWSSEVERAPIRAAWWTGEAEVSSLLLDWWR